MNHCDVLIIGAGIIGAALADALSARGLAVTVLEAGVPGAGTTAAGMGHLVVLDDNPAELALSADGVARWRALAPALPATAEYRPCGTLWLARDAEEMSEAERRHARCAARGQISQLLGAAALYRAEPNLARGLKGALRMPDEGVLYPPIACAWLLGRAQSQGARVLRGVRVEALVDGGVRLADGRVLRAADTVIAAGNASATLLPGLPLSPRKGHLVITERYPDAVHHQLVALDYIRSAQAGDGDSVAFNVQPRATGQLLIGSSRQYGDPGPDVVWPLLRRMLESAYGYLPMLRSMQALRVWTGLRPATPDKLPLLGPVPDREGLWLATGHEGLGITTALSSAALLAAQIAGAPLPLDPCPYAPARFGMSVHA